MNQVLINTIVSLLKKEGRNGLSFRSLVAKCHYPYKKRREIKEAILILEKRGVIIDNRDKLYHVESMDLKPAIVTRLNKTFGFVKLKEDESEVFIPGKFLLGALPGDSVLISSIESRGQSPEGEIIKIIKEGSSLFVGVLHQDENGYYVTPDEMGKFDLRIKSNQLKNAKVNEKVICSIVERGFRHSDHVARIIKSYGDSQTAVNCAEAILDMNGISLEFPPDVNQLALHLNERGIHPKEMENRLDLRNEKIFTIDSADTKDIDDAISIKKVGDYYELGVHIADVSYYVTKGSAIDDEAFKRGTSIYFADRVVPMLPAALSNGICSLNEKVDRLTFSCIMAIDAHGKLVDFSFHKSIINSKVKGVYAEINQILSKTESNDIKRKYRGLYESIHLMKKLADILTANRKKRGCPEIETAESKIYLDENKTPIEIRPRTRGASEVIIEEFMLMANEAAATAARLKEIPFVYRVHEPPSEEKLLTLHQMLNAIGMDCGNIKLGLPASVLAKLITEAKGKPTFNLINTLVLRSMSKAKYFEMPLGHYGLVLDNYAQFTSPIRRYPDLTIHRVLSEVVKGTPLPKIRKKFEHEVISSSRQSTETELKAMRLERDCEDCYKAEYMKNHIGEEYDGIISSIANNGIYVELPNTVEGMIRVDDLPEGEYDMDYMLECKNLSTGKAYRIGESVKVRCIWVDVSEGKINFELC